MFSTPILVLLSTFFSLAHAAPIPVPSPSPSPINLFGIDLDFGDDNTSDAAPVAVQSNEPFIRPALFSRVAYCSSASVTSWTCGGPCTSLGGNVDVLQAGGDDGLVPMYFIAHDPDTDTIVVAHQGTEPDNILSIINDAEFFLTDLNTTHFPSAVGLGIEVHSGFQRTFARTADGLLQGVINGLASTGASKVLVTGHSLGAAIATLDALMLQDALDPSIEISTVVFGLPRVGNQEWADFVDSKLTTPLSRITNQNDPVPIVPPRFLGFQHPSGEVHINTPDVNVVSCVGQENENCSAGNGLLDASVANHLGPYFEDISFGGAACPA